MIPHAEIRAKHDRSWSFRLLDALLHSRPEEDIGEIIETIAALDDPRLVPPMVRLLEDASQPAHLREFVSEVLGQMCTGCSEADRRRWWSSGDRILRRHAIIEARTSEADILIPIARDPSHEFHLDAINSLLFGFEEPEQQRLSIQALSHPNPGVRMAAANNLKWEEPFEAESALLEAISDPVFDVADRALTTISWFRSQKVLTGLAELRYCAAEDFREEVEGVFECHKQEFEDALSDLEGESKEFFLTWLKPIENLVSLECPRVSEQSVEELSQLSTEPLPKANAPEIQRLRSSALEIMRFYDDADGCWIEKQSWNSPFNWEEVGVFDRQRLARYFLNHTDHLVREMACTPLSLWNFGEDLEALLEDRCGGVRKAAAFAMRRVTPSRLIALSLWNLYQNVNSTGYCATETLESYVVHAPAIGLEDTLFEIAQSDRRQNRRSSAIALLCTLYADVHLIKLLGLLGEPPLLTWAIHAQLIDYCAEKRISTPFFADLSQVDDLNLQRSLAGAVPHLQPVILKGVSYAAKT
jgi:HEAT repeat protein